MPYCPDRPNRRKRYLLEKTNKNLSARRSLKTVGEGPPDILSELSFLVKTQDHETAEAF